jgi:hypothetical protein
MTVVKAEAFELRFLESLLLASGVYPFPCLRLDWIDHPNGSLAE